MYSFLSWACSGVGGVKYLVLGLGGRICLLRWGLLCLLSTGTLLHKAGLTIRATGHLPRGTLHLSGPGQRQLNVISRYERSPYFP